jgi:pSer/pThr/pTyr-binding forkhead associated (FHA) protein
MDALPTPAGAPELVICNGRQKGTRRLLSQPLTLIGREAGCDLRLNVEGVGALHCGLVNGASGLFLSKLPGDAPTLVNGQAVTDCRLNHGDVLTIGPFQFQIHLPPSLLDHELSGSRAQTNHEREALRIQAAAVAAQQAALAEEEGRLQQRRAALKQQEEQLSTHLEDKRRRLLELRDQLRAAQSALRHEQAAQETKVRSAREQIGTARREVSEAKKQVESERDRLVKLAKRMKRRWQQQAAAERAAIQQREAEVARRQREFDDEKEKLRVEREQLNQTRLRSNGETELSRRQLKADWEAFREEQRREDERIQHEHGDLRKRSLALDQRAAALAHTERELEDQRHHCQTMHIQLEREAEGLENRIRNYRAKISDLEKQLLDAQTRAAAAVQAATDTAAPPASASAAPVSGDASTAVAATSSEGTVPLEPDDNPAVQKADEKPEAMSEPLSFPAEAPAPAAPSLTLVPALPPASATPAPETKVQTLPSPDENQFVQQRLAHLEKLSGELADERLHLVEQCQRLVTAQHHWQQERDTAAAELEELGKRLQAREAEIGQRDKALHIAEERQRQLHEQAAALQRHLEAWQARVTARETTWESDRDRLLFDVSSKEKLAELRLKAIGQLHERWLRRRRREIQWIQGERTAYAKLRHEYAALRQDLLRRSAQLERDQRALAERALAVEQFQQECVASSAYPAAASRRLEKLRGHWASLTTKAQKTLNEQREALAKEAAELDQQFGRLKKQADKIAAQEAELSRQLSTWEHARLMANDEIEHVRINLQNSQAQRDRYEKQVNDLRDEVERLARLLLDESEPVVIAPSKAA